MEMETDDVRVSWGWKQMSRESHGMETDDVRVSWGWKQMLRDSHGDGNR